MVHEISFPRYNRMGCGSSQNTVSPDAKPEAKEKPSAKAPAKVEQPAIEKKADANAPRKLHVVHFNDVGERDHHG